MYWLRDESIGEPPRAAAARAPAPRRRRSSRVRREVTRDASLAYWPRCSCCSLAARLPPLLPPLLPRLLLAALLPPLLRPILGRDKHAVVAGCAAGTAGAAPGQ